MRRPIWLALAALVAASGLAAGWRAVQGAGGGDDVPVARVERGSFTRSVRAEGYLEAVEATPLGAPPEVSTALKIAWLAPDGSAVRAGDVVIRFDPTEMEKNLADGKSERAVVESRIDQTTLREGGTERNLERDAALAGLQLEHSQQFQSKDAEIFSRLEIVEAEIDSELATQRKGHAERSRTTRAGLTRAELDLLGIERRKAELKIQQAERGLAGLEVKAPHDGIFVLKQTWGQVAEVGEVVWGGEPLAELPRLDAMQARVHVLEADAGGLREGLEVTLALESRLDDAWKGKVTQVDRLAMRRNRRAPIQYFGVVVTPERTDPELMKPGQRVVAHLALEARESALSIPRQAVFQQEGKSVVYRRNGRGFEPVTLELGPAALGRVVVESGLEEGDAVALWDPTRPRPGQGGSRQESPGVGGAPGAAG